MVRPIAGHGLRIRAYHFLPGTPHAALARPCAAWCSAGQGEITMNTTPPFMGMVQPEADRASRLEAAHKRISNAVAYGLMVYTGLQIFLTMRALEVADNSLLPMVGLVVLVGAIIPLYRRLEKQWDATAARLADDPPALAAALTRARLTIWAISIGLPLLVTVLVAALVSVVAG
jgi:hypothetical protein